MGIEPTRDRVNRLSTALKAVGRTSVPSASVRRYITPRVGCTAPVPVARVQRRRAEGRAE